MGVELVLLRHRESEWDLANRFTGWTDAALTERGIQEARRAGRLLRAAGYVFDELHTSVLRPAIQILWIAMDEKIQEATSSVARRALAAKNEGFEGSQ